MENVKDIIFEGIERFVLQKILKPNPDPEYYNKEMKPQKKQKKKSEERTIGKIR
jgi:hypothetical protein